jgi:hypothetical protein
MHNRYRPTTDRAMQIQSLLLNLRPKKKEITGTNSIYLITTKPNNNPCNPWKWIAGI